MHRTRDMGEGNHSRQWNCLLAQQTNLKNDICGYLNKKSNGKLGRINTKSPPIENRLNDTKRLYLESSGLKQTKYDGGNAFVLVFVSSIAYRIHTLCCYRFVNTIVSDASLCFVHLLCIYHFRQI
eukprot:175433_1